ncbi:MAG: class III poly(R)-hydroxyalkanoic acid synthase subunit PhaC [Gammaproteobacteria bacterium]
MPKIALTPDALQREIRSFSENFTQAQKNFENAANLRPGCSERERVFSIDNVGLYHYEPRAKSSNKTPLLIVYALVNRAEMADLQEDRSLIRSLLDQGLDIYLIDWDYPDGSNRLRTMDNYINRYIGGCVEYICRENGLDAINILGICQGGTMSCCYSALHPKRVRNLITTVTPVDFSTRKDMLSHIFRQVDVDLLVDGDGNLSGDLLNLIFLSLKPFRLAQQKYVDLIGNSNDPATVEMFMRMEHWIFDSPSLAGQAFKEFAKQFYQGNLLIKGEVEIGGRRVDLKNLTSPVLNIFGRDDHLVPPAASKALGQYVGTKDYTELEFPGGHIGIYVSGRAHKLVPPAIVEWLNAR